MIPQEIIDDVRASTNIVDVISQFVQLRQAGPNWKGLCPFHEEKTPSFNVNEPRQIYHCFGCGEGGNVFSFLQKLENRTFPEVVEMLAERAGIQMPEKDESPEQKKARSERDQLYRANEAARTFFQKQLASNAGKAAYEYVRGRGFSDELIEELGVGYCGPGWDAFAKYCQSRRHPLRVAEKAGLVVKGKRGTYYDRFHERLVFPITNRSSRVIGFGGRLLEGEGPKYLNSAETPIYHKQEAVFGIDLARAAIGKRERVLIVEGYFDVMALAQHGFRESVATCGTALTAGHIGVLRRYTTGFVLLYDGDAAGRKAAMRCLPMFVEAGLSAHVVLLPAEHDPDTYVQEKGAEALEQLIERATPLEKLSVIEARRRGRDDVSGRLEVAKRLAGVFSKAPERLARLSYASLVADTLDLPEDLVQGLFEGDPSALAALDAPPPPPRQKPFRRFKGPGRPTEAENEWTQGQLQRDERLRPLLTQRSNPEETLVKLMLVSPQVAATVGAVGILLRFSDERLRALGEMITTQQREGERPIEPADLLDRVTDEKHRRIIESIDQDVALANASDFDAIAQDCIETILKNSHKDQRKALRAAIEAAERAGDEERVLALQQELLEELKAPEAARGVRDEEQA